MNYLAVPNAGADAAWLTAPTGGKEDKRPVSYDSRFFYTPNANAVDAGERFQEPPIALRSLAPAAFPSGGTPVNNIYGWTEYQ